MNTEEFNKRMNELYKPPVNQFIVLDVPEISYMMIDGDGNPDSEAFQNSMKWLYSVVHFIKPLVKKEMGKRFVEPPLECLFWADSIQDFVSGNKDKWKWRVMIVYVPELISQKDFEEAVSKVEQKLGDTPETFRIENIEEGKSVQIMHVGEYAEIQAVCHKLYNEFLPKNDLKTNGYYHEIYLNDPNRVAPEKRKVVIRQPVICVDRFK